MKINLDCFNDILHKTVLQKKKRHVLIYIVIGSIILAISQIGRSFLIGQLVESLNLKYLYYYIGIFIIAYLVNAAQLFTLNRQVIGYKKNMFHYLVDKLYYARQQDADPYQTTILNDMNESMINVNMMSFTFLTSFINRWCVVKLTIIVFIYYLPYVGIAMLVGIIIIFFFYMKCLQKLHQSWLRYWREYTDFNRQFQDIMMNNWNIRYHHLHSYMKERLRPYLDRRFDTFLSWLDQQVIVFELPSILFFILMSIAIAYIVKTPSLRLSTRVFLIYTLYKAWLDLYQLCSQYTEVFKQSKYVAKICPAWNLDAQVDPQGSWVSAQSIQSIRFDKVSFSYGNGNLSPILERVSFTLQAGQIANIIAASGKGKSTIFHLIARIYDLDPTDGGDIYLNQISIQHWNPYRLRELIAVVPQKISVFEGTVEENIVLDRKNHPQRLDTLLKVCDLDKNRLAQNLSQGGQQRVLVARALYDTSKSLFLMDEYLSAVDQQRADIIHQYVLGFIKNHGKIGIFISHDPNRQQDGDVMIQI